MTDPHAPRRSTVALEHGEVSYLEWGAAGAPTIVLLHGGGFDGASMSWSRLGPALAAAGYRVLAPDHPGYGESPAPTWPAHLEHSGRYVDEFIDRVVDGDYALGGLSLGGALALQHALGRGEGGGPRALLLLGSYGLMPRMGRGPLAAATQGLTWAAARSGLIGALTPRYARNRALMRLSLRNLVHNPAEATPALLDEIIAAGAVPGAGAAFAEFQRSEIGPRGLRTDFTPRLGELAMPVLLVHGGRDIGVPVERARAAARRIPDAELRVVEGGGHWVQRDRPDEVHAAILDFLARRLGTAPPARIRALAGDDALELVWRNELGGTTHRATGADGRTRYLKHQPLAGLPPRERADVDLVVEADKLRWAARWAAVPRVLEVGADGDEAWLVTAGIDAVSAFDARWRDDPETAVRAIAVGLRRLHDALPVDECPYRGSWYDLDAAPAPPVADLVVCHGDPCVPNTLLDDAGRFAAHVDLARLGVADRWSDVAIAMASIGWPVNFGREHDERFLEAYGMRPDAAAQDRMSVYRELWDAPGA
ncbi:MAG: alpha/beta fold hydrolase [Microbacteriaceae bacterium]|nr:alpha/beta fold hydrolase [Microbacteriaceae bacterium]